MTACTGWVLLENNLLLGKSEELVGALRGTSAAASRGLYRSLTSSRPVVCLPGFSSRLRGLQGGRDELGRDMTECLYVLICHHADQVIG